MTIEEALKAFYNTPKDKKPEIGKYWASGIYSIMKGYTTTGNYFKEKPVDEQGGFNIFWGCASEDELSRILTDQKFDFKQQTRHELDLGEYKISGKTDFEFPEMIIECKCPKEHTEGIPDKWKAQLEFYYRATGKKIILGIFNKTGDKIISLYTYEPNDIFWIEIQNALSDFHKRLVKKSLKLNVTN